MQIYALDSLGKLTPSSQATKSCNYYCAECQGVVRLRGGIERRLHFYHLDPSPSCRQNGKSEEHLALQRAVQTLFQDCLLEKRFDKIHRIADCFSPSKNLVIEVQCSMITAAEVQARMEDYSSLDLNVIWILHDSTFNRLKMTAAEAFLRPYTHFFSNMNAHGRGLIYSQTSTHKGGLRFSRGPKVPIDLRHIDPTPFRKIRPSLFSQIKKLIGMK